MVVEVILPVKVVMDASVVTVTRTDGPPVVPEGVGEENCNIHHILHFGVDLEMCQVPKRTLQQTLIPFAA